jgi:serine/threonine protein kinase
VLLKILQEPVPPIDEKWSNCFADFVAICLEKDESKRPKAADLLEHPFLSDAEIYE